MGRPSPDEVERSIYFYAADAGVDGSGRFLHFDHASVLDAIDGIPQDDPERLMRVRANQAAYCWVHSHVAPQRIRLAIVRSAELPEVFERRGDLSPLIMSGDAEGIAESIHIVFFENNIVGADFNFYGPRISSLHRYFVGKAHHVSSELRAFGFLADPDVERRLDGFQDLRQLQIRMRPADAEVLRNYHRGLAGAFDAASEYLEPDAEMELIWRPKAHSRGKGIGREILNAVRNIYRQERLHGRADIFRVQGIDGFGNSTDLVDLLSDNLVARKKMVRQNPLSRAVVADSAYGAIEEAYRELQHKFNRASSLYILREYAGE